MKKRLLALLLAALMVVTVLPMTAFATPDSVPTVTDVSGAGYDASYVLAVYFDEQITKDVVWTGTYNAWSTNVGNMVKFEALDGFSGWYVAEFEDESSSCQGKIVQLMNDDSFNTYYQYGDTEAFINMAQPGTKQMSIDILTSGETMCTLPEKGVYIYEVYGFTYPVIDGTAQDANGSITVVKTARKNKNVTVTVNPASGYQLKTLKWYPSDTPASTTDITTLKSFKMPAYAVTVTAEFVKDLPSGATDWVVDSGDDHVWYKLEGSNTKLTIGGTGAMPNFADVNNAPWYGNKSTITTVVIESGVTAIGKYAFTDYTNVVNVTIPSTVETIGDYAFRGCKFGSLVLPAGLTSLGIYAFHDCENLESVTLPAGLTTLKDGAFTECDKLSSVTLPAALTTIGIAAFQDCPELKSITIPETVETIGAGAFAKSGLTTITLPANVTSIGEVAFYDCPSLATVTLPANVTTIGYWAFLECPSLTTITLKATTPPTLDEDAIPACTTAIYVPAGTDETYKEAAGWIDYKDIIKGAYTVSVSIVGPGTVTVDKDLFPADTYTTANETVNVTVTPDEGYQLKSLKYNDGEDHDITSAKSFTMPPKDVTVTAEFEEISGPGPDDDHDVDYEKLAKAGMVAAGVVAGVVVTKIVVDKLHEIKAAKDAAAEVTPVIIVEEMPMVAIGDSGDAVVTLQTKLNALGYNCGEVDGIFGSNTYAAVCSFQTAKGLTVDGIVGTQTWAELL